MSKSIEGKTKVALLNDRTNHLLTAISACGRFSEMSQGKADENADLANFPSRREGVRSGLLHLIPNTRRVILVCVVVIAASYSFAVAYTKSFEMAFPYLLGQRLFASESRVDLAPVAPLTRKTNIQLLIFNHGNTDGQILGAMKSCNCLRINHAFPIVIPRNSSLSLQVSVDAFPVSGTFHHVLTLLTNDPTRPKQAIEIAGRVAEVAVTSKTVTR